MVVLPFYRAIRMQIFGRIFMDSFGINNEILCTQVYTWKNDTSLREWRGGWRMMEEVNSTMIYYKNIL
jgi:hypothetical protein